MNKKRVLVYITAAAVIIGSSSFVFAAKNSVDSAKNVTESVALQADKDESENKAGYISDEEAKEAASRALKYYLNKDINYDTDVNFYRENDLKDTEIELDGQKYMVSEKSASIYNGLLEGNHINEAKRMIEMPIKMPGIVTVGFEPKDLENSRYTWYQVEIDGDTREIISVIAFNKQEEFKGEPDKNKIREVVINFFNSLNIKIDKESIPEEGQLVRKYGRVTLDLKNNDGKEVTLTIDLKDYSVMDYTKTYLKWPE